MFTQPGQYSLSLRVKGTDLSVPSFVIIDDSHAGCGIGVGSLASTAMSGYTQYIWNVIVDVYQEKNTYVAGHLMGLWVSFLEPAVDVVPVIGLVQLIISAITTAWVITHDIVSDLT
jgi:hypothetical protein